MQAVMFSGQGAQRVGMGSRFFGYRSMEECLATASAIVGYDIKKICQDGPQEELTRTEICQVALFTVGYGIFCCLRERGFLQNLEVCFGLSLGEWTALAAGGAIDFAEGVHLVAERAKWMQWACDTTRGTMVGLLGGDRGKIWALCREWDVEISNYNAPDQVVLSGEREKIERAVANVGSCGIRKVISLDVAGAYHSRLMLTARKGFEKAAQSANFRTPSIPVLSNVTGQPFRDGEEIRHLVIEQITSPVRWETCMDTAAKMDVENFCECGSGKVLVGLAQKNLPHFRAKCAEELDTQDWGS